MPMTDSMTAACAERDRVIFARNREIAERDAEIERLNAYIAKLRPLFRKAMRKLDPGARESLLNEAFVEWGKR